MEQYQSLFSVLNVVGFPCVAVWAFHKGYVVSPRELTNSYKQLEQVSARCDRLEADLSAEREYTRRELDETRALLIKLVAGEVTPSGAAAIMVRDVSAREG